MNQAIFFLNTAAVGSYCECLPALCCTHGRQHLSSVCCPHAPFIGTYCCVFLVSSNPLLVLPPSALAVEGVRG